MKKLSKLKLSEKVDTLTDSEMKMIFGSSGAEKDKQCTATCKDGTKYSGTSCPDSSADDTYCGKHSGIRYCACG